jgi:hypothetical protein
MSSKRTLSLGFFELNFGYNYTVRNGNLEVSVYLLKAKQGYTVRKLKKKKT